MRYKALGEVLRGIIVGGQAQSTDSIEIVPYKRFKRKIDGFRKMI
jgi:hypothetical protein